MPDASPYPQVRRIAQVAADLGLDPDEILPHGHYIAKVPIDELTRRADQPDGRLVLVTAMTPTPQGEGKTTAAIGLTDALRRCGHKAGLCLREPSLGPYFGVKGGGTGAGRAQLFPAEDINLHFVGDMYSVSKANNLLACMVDNHLQWGNALNIDPRRIVLRRVIDLNDRALREIFVGLGGVLHGVPRRDGFMITPACEVMAMLCLAQDYADLGRRLAATVVGFTYDGRPIRAADLGAHGAMQVLLRDAIHPNLVQTLEGSPAFVHAGPFASIAQGTNTAIATRMALKLCDYVVTEAGFASDLGAEKFINIKCRSAGLQPSVAVVVATAKAIAYHGGRKPNGGFANLARHLANVRSYGLSPVVALSRFPEDRDQDLAEIIAFCAEQGAPAVICTHFDEGGAGAMDLAQAVVAADAAHQGPIRFTYPLDMPLVDKIRTVATTLYGAADISLDKAARQDLTMIEANGFGSLPICIAKTSRSLSDDSTRRGTPQGFTLHINELRLCAGAGFVVAIAGNIMTMPGLPREPAAARIRVDDQGRVSGLT